MFNIIIKTQDLTGFLEEITYQNITINQVNEILVNTKFLVEMVIKKV